MRTKFSVGNTVCHITKTQNDFQSVAVHNQMQTTRTETKICLQLKIMPYITPSSLLTAGNQLNF